MMPIDLLESGEDPFKPAPDPRFLYFNEDRRKTYDGLIADVRGGRPCTLLIGGSGIGKTTLLGKLQRDLGDSEFQVIFPSYTRLSFEDLLDSCRELGADGLGLDGWEEVVPEEERSKKPLLILIDEAQVMTDEALERLCQLCATDRTPSVQVLFAGQPELAERLTASGINAARACAEGCHSLDRLDEVETTAYIIHRLSVAGAPSENVFDTDASERVARLAGGVPRLINRLSGTSLHLARNQDAATVSTDIVDLAAAICEPATDVDSGLLGDADPRASGDAADDAKEAAGDDVLTLKVDVLAVEQEIERAEEQSRQRHRRETAAMPGASELAGPQARQASSGASGLTLVLRGFLIGAAMGAALMVGYLLTAEPGEDSFLSPAKLAELWQSLQAAALSESEPDSGQILSAASNNPGSPPVIVASAASGPEGEPITLDIEVSHPADIDADGVTVRISGLPEDGALSAGTRQADGSWRLTLAEIAGVQFVPAPDFSGSLALEVAATARDRNGAEGNAAIAFASTRLPLTVVGVADPPRLEVSGGAGKAGEPIPLAIEAAVMDRDGSESLTIEVQGLPLGWQLSAGNRSDDGTWTLTPAALDGLTATSPLDALAGAEIEVRAVAEEADGDRAVTAARTTFGVEPNLRKPDLEVAESAGEEDLPVALAIGVTTEDVRGPEGVRVTLRGLPEGATLSAGAPAEAGTWRLRGDELEGLTVIPPVHFSGRFELSVEADVAGVAETAVSALLPVVVTPRADQPTLAVTPAEGLEDEAIPLAIAAETPDGDGSESLTIDLDGLPPDARLSLGEQQADGTWRLSADQLDGLTVTPPPHFSGAMPLTIRATTTESGSEPAVAEARLTVQVRGVADPPSLAVESASGVAGRPIALSISALSGDLDGSEELTVALAGLPEGATLSRGELRPDGTWMIGAEQLAGLVMTTDPKTIGRFPLTVTLYAEEAEGDRATAVAEIALTLLALKDLVVIEAADAGGQEDSAIPLEVAVAGIEQAGGSLSLRFTGLAEGAALSIGVEDDKGRWRLEPAQLDELQLLPPSDFSGTMTVTVQASSAFEDEAELPSALMTVDVAAVADPPALVVSEARGEAGTPIELAISASLSDLDGSERLSLAVENLPKRFTLSAGRRAAHGTWRLEPEDLGTLALESPADYRGRFALKVVARADESNGSFAETVATLPVIVEGVVVAAPEPEPVEAGTLESDAAETAASAEPPAAQSDADPEVAAPANDWIARGDQLLSLGDIAAARLFYELAAQQGHAEAATAMGRTYDPAFLKERKVIGVPGNPALAAEWYRRAAEAGDPEAQSLLERTSGQP